MRSTQEMRRLATVLLAGSVETRFYSGDLRRAARMHSRRLYPLVTLLLERGWLADEWDEPAPETPQPQRYYMLTDLGRQELAKAHPAA
jgi:DNA-binding PadR family transcriptional regulator